MTCSIRYPSDKGRWFVSKQELKGEDVWVLSGAGGWDRNFNPDMFMVGAIEVVGTTPEAIADYLQELRDKAPEVPSTCISLDLCDAGLYSEVATRKLVLECYVILHRRFDDKIGPLRSMRHAVLDLFESDSLMSKRKTTPYKVLK